MPFRSITPRVCGGPLDSPSVTPRASRSRSSVTSWLSVSLCVEPGASSAVLKLGFTTTRFPAMPSGLNSFSTSATPRLRSAVRTSATRLVRPTRGIRRPLGPTAGSNASPAAVTRRKSRRSMR